MISIDQLSNREKEILRLVATGVSNKEISRELVISVNTVKVHLRNIYQKIEVSSRTEATMWAVEVGLVTPLINTQTSDTASSDTNAESVLEKETRRRNRRILIVAIVGVSILIFISVIFLVLRFSTTLNTPVTVQEFEQERWENLTEMTSGRSNFATAVINKFIYVIGGETEAGISSRVELYNVEDDAWSSGADLPVSLRNIEAETIGGNIYVPGGLMSSGAVSDKVFVYQPVDDLWSEAAPLPQALSSYGLTAFEGNLYLFGGWNGTEYVNTVLIYDPSVDAWEEATPMTIARGECGAVVSGGNIHIIGGVNDQQTLRVHEVYSPDQEDSGGNPWTTAGQLPEGLSNFGIVSIADIIHVIGGGNEQLDKAVAYKYAPQSDKWQQFETPFSQPLTGLEASVIGERIYLLGGDSGGELVNSNVSYQAVYLISIPALPASGE